MNEEEEKLKKFHGCNKVATKVFVIKLDIVVHLHNSSKRMAGKERKL